jgi:uncharacterized coiled-coil protein SlyX
MRLNAIFSALALQPLAPSFNVVHRIRALPCMQQSAPPLQQIQTESELKSALSRLEPMGIALLMCSVRGDKKASKVRSHLVDKCGDNERLTRLLWECDSDDKAALAAMGAEPSRMPFFIGFDSNGERVLDFVAQTPSALFYGLENFGGVLDAYAEQDSEQQPAATAPAAANADAAAANDKRVAALELNTEIMEAEIYDLKLQVSKQQAELFGASLKFEALVKRVEELEQGPSSATALSLAANTGSLASSGPGSEALATFLADAPDEADDVPDPFAFVLGDDA